MTLRSHTQEKMWTPMCTVSEAVPAPLPRRQLRERARERLERAQRPAGLVRRRQRHDRAVPGPVHHVGRADGAAALRGKQTLAPSCAIAQAIEVPA